MEPSPRIHCNDPCMDQLTRVVRADVHAQKLARSGLFHESPHFAYNPCPADPLGPLASDLDGVAGLQRLALGETHERNFRVRENGARRGSIVHRAPGATNRVLGRDEPVLYRHVGVLVTSVLCRPKRRRLPRYSVRSF